MVIVIKNILNWLALGEKSDELTMKISHDSSLLEDQFIFFYMTEKMRQKLLNKTDKIRKLENLMTYGCPQYPFTRTTFDNRDTFNYSRTRL